MRPVTDRTVQALAREEQRSPSHPGISHLDRVRDCCARATGSPRTRQEPSRGTPPPDTVPPHTANRQITIAPARPTIISQGTAATIREQIRGAPSAPQ